PEAFQRNRDLVLRFYNERRRQLQEVEPNRAHRLLAELESQYRVTVVTQNVDNLHERGGSTNVVHLHGELTKARSTVDPELVYDIGYRDIQPGDTCDRGGQLRPHIVWFGEEVPMLEAAAELVRTADRLLIVGTSLQVYPAAGLVHEVDFDVPITVIDPGEPASVSRARVIRKGACEGLAEWVEMLG
ncbi:MAG: Sir2 family NAD-dependent protein deacetylase, partial [Marinobacter sp.]